MEQSSRTKTTLAILALALFAIMVFGLIWFFFIGPVTPVGLGWYLFSFAAGLTMIVLPCTLPLAFVIVPLSMGKGAIKGIGMAIAFGLGVAIMLSLYGVIAAIVGEVAIGTLGAPLEVVKNWLYFVAGAIAFLFALGEIGLVKYRMPSYTGAAPAFIQKRGDYVKAFLLGLFLGNIGVGCPHPATPVILTRIAASGNVFYGWLLFFVHAVGRVLPLLLLAFLGILGVNALSWLVARKEKVERATGWGMVFVAAFILILGLFTHDWWVYSGQHTLLEEITGEEYFLGAIIHHFHLGGTPHAHGIPSGHGIFGLPLWLGNWVLVFLWVMPLWWYYFKKKKVEPALASLRFWFYLSFSALLALTFIWVLPDRFLNHQHPQHFLETIQKQQEHPHAGSATGNAKYSEEKSISQGVAVNLNMTPVPVHTGSTTRLDFFVNEKPDNAPIPASELELEHTKIMHVIGIRDDMNEFFHIHPEATATPGVLSVEHVFENPGRYKIWSEIKKDGVNYAFGHPEFAVAGDGTPAHKEVNFGRNQVVDNYQVSLEVSEPVSKDQAADLTLDVHTLTGAEIELEQYLGASMHLTLIKDDWTQFIHTHPGGAGHEHGELRFLPIAQGHGNEEEERVAPMKEVHGVPFIVVFPEAGLYRAFVQFRPKDIDLPPDEALTASFWINVQEQAPGISPTVTNKITLVAISLILMTLLSWGVRRYLNVKAQMTNAK